MTPHSIYHLLAGNCLRPFFQPVVSTSEGVIWGFEGLTRGLDPRTSTLILPEKLFERAGREGTAVVLDAACQSAILQEYGKRFRRNRTALLFLNTHPESIEKDGDSDRLLAEVRRNGLHPRNIVIEIDESAIADTSLLESFVNSHRERGFLIAFDDFGTGSFSMQRVPLLRPDFLKIDISIVRSIHRQPAARYAFREFCATASENGAVVIAEGVETEEEARDISRLGGSLIQGFYFSRPVELHTIDRRAERRIASLCRQMGPVGPTATSLHPDKTGILVCPACRSTLRVVPERETEGSIETGSLHCVGCQSIFPIVRGIPVLLSPEKPYPGL